MTLKGGDNMNHDFKKLLELQNTMKRYSDIFNSPSFQSSIRLAESTHRLTSSLNWKQLTMVNKINHQFYSQISPALLQQIQLQYELLAKYDFPSVNANIRIQNDHMAKEYLADIINDVNWEAMEQAGIKVEIPPELASAVKSESPSIEVQSDLTETEKEESSFKDTLAIICYWITIWRFAVDAVNCVSNQTNREKAYALYFYIKEYFANFIDP